MWRKGLLVGALVGVACAALWVTYVWVTPTISAEMPGVNWTTPASRGGFDFDLNACTDCPRYSLLGHGILSSDSYPHFSAFAWLHYPALLLSSGSPGRFRIRSVEPWAFFPLVVLQWAVLGGLVASVASWRRNRAGR